jgi:NTP pyrophosphatase (non-canonical NTP hydrolase)
MATTTLVGGVDFSAMTQRALDVRELYEAHERERYGRVWSLQELTLGFVGDVGDLAKLVQAHVGVRDIDNATAALEDELADVLWSVIVIARRCDVDLEAAFSKTMADLTHTLTDVRERSGPDTSG